MSNHNGAAGVGQQHGPAAKGAAENGAAEKPAPREANGRFAAGNKGGPGNPFGRQMAERRKAITEAVSKEMLQEIMTTLVRLAIAGDVGAAKLVLQYGVGKPAAAAEPDRVDVDEWNLHREEAIQNDEFNRVVDGSPIRLANGTAELLTPKKEQAYGAMVRGDIAATGDEDEEDGGRGWWPKLVGRFDARQRQTADRPSVAATNGPANGKNGHGQPSANGTNGKKFPA